VIKHLKIKLHQLPGIHDGAQTMISVCSHSLNLIDNFSWSQDSYLKQVLMKHSLCIPRQWSTSRKHSPNILTKNSLDLFKHQEIPQWFLKPPCSQSVSLKGIQPVVISKLKKTLCNPHPRNPPVKKQRSNYIIVCSLFEQITDYQIQLSTKHTHIKRIDLLCV
jgi:hypothetical protein